MNIDVEDVKKFALKPDDILWFKMQPEADMAEMNATAKTLKAMLASAGKNNRVLVTKSNCDIAIIGSDTLPKDVAIIRGANGKAVIIDNIGPSEPQCDCGGAATGGGHASYCSTQRRSP